MTTTIQNGGLAAIRRFRLNVPQKIALLTATVALAAVTLFLTVVVPLAPQPTALNLPWVLWAGAFSISEMLIVHVQWKRESHTFSLSDLVLAAGLALAAPTDLVLAQVVGTTVVLVLYRRQRGLKLAFNTVQFALSGAMAVLVHSTVIALAGPQWGWLGQLLAIAVATMAASITIFAVMTISAGRADLQPLVGMLAFSLPFTLGSGAVGVVLSRTSGDDLSRQRLLRLATAHGSLLSRAGAGRRDPLDGYAGERGLKDAMVAALRTEDRVHGLLLVGGCSAAGTTFNRSDLALLETFGRHVATSLERGRGRARGWAGRSGRRAASGGAAAP